MLAVKNTINTGLQPIKSTDRLWYRRETDAGDLARSVDLVNGR